MTITTRAGDTAPPLATPGLSTTGTAQRWRNLGLTATAIMAPAGAGYLSPILGEVLAGAESLAGLLILVAYALDTIRARRRYQQLHDDIARHLLPKIATIEQGLLLLDHVAATHPDHLGTRLTQERLAAPERRNRRARR